MQQGDLKENTSAVEKGHGGGKIARVGPFGGDAFDDGRLSEGKTASTHDRGCDFQEH